MKTPLPPAIATAFLLATSFACRPVFAIGWTELALIAVIMLVLFAPLLFRLFRFLMQKDETTNKKAD
jgi:hypothetical protein